MLVVDVAVSGLILNSKVEEGLGVGLDRGDIGGDGGSGDSGGGRCLVGAYVLGGLGTLNQTESTGHGIRLFLLKLGLLGTVKFNQSKTHLATSGICRRTIGLLLLTHFPKVSSFYRRPPGTLGILSSSFCQSGFSQNWLFLKEWDW